MFGMLVAVAAAALIPAELGAHRAAAGKATVARSVDGQRNQMIACIAQLRRTDTARADRAETAASRTCLDRAQRILARSPTRSSAHVVRAIALSDLGEQGRAAGALEMAQQTGSLEGWLAVVRLRTALAIADRANLQSIRDRMESVAAADLAVVARSPRLAPRLALLYHEAGARRPWIVEEIETYPTGVQSAFLLAVERLRSGPGAR